MRAIVLLVRWVKDIPQPWNASVYELMKNGNAGYEPTG
jgi:hypothetical protein